MNKIFRNIGLLALACFSFLITDETIKVVKETDKLMIEIKNIASNYYVEEVNAKVKDKYIIVGHNGLEIDVDSSYQNMKKIGYFNENMLIYKNIKPEISIADYKDKIINGNSKNEVSLIFKNPNDLDGIISILKSNNIGASFFIDLDYYKNNYESVELITHYNHDLGFLNNYKELRREFNGMNYYCYSSINNCVKDSKYTVEATTKINNLKELKKNLKKGTIIEINGDDYLDIYIKYILSKGYKIVKISDFINEELK